MMRPTLDCSPKRLARCVFDDPAGKMNLALADVAGSVLVVSQFTLLGDCRKGRRPSFTSAAPPERAEPLYEFFVDLLRRQGHEVQTGRFRAEMLVELTNDGPVTLIIESQSLREGRNRLHGTLPTGRAGGLPPGRWAGDWATRCTEALLSLRLVRLGRHLLRRVIGRMNLVHHCRVSERRNRCQQKQRIGQQIGTHRFAPKLHGGAERTFESKAASAEVDAQISSRTRCDMKPIITAAALK